MRGAESHGVDGGAGVRIGWLLRRRDPILLVARLQKADPSNPMRATADRVGNGQGHGGDGRPGCYVDHEMMCRHHDDDRRQQGVDDCDGAQRDTGIQVPQGHGDDQGPGDMERGHGSELIGGAGAESMKGE